MVWIVKLEERQVGKIVSRRKVFTIDRPTVIDLSDDIGLGREDANVLLSSLQQILVTSQFDHDTGHRGACDTCGQKRNVKDYRSRKIDTLYGRVTIRQPRYLCPHWGPCHSPLIARSTPEFDLIRSTLAAHLPYRVASELLSTLVPADSGTTHTTIRNRIAHVAEQLNTEEEKSYPCTESSKSVELTLGLDSAFIRSTTPSMAGHHMVLVGCVENEHSSRLFAGLQAQSSVASHLIRTHLERTGYHRATELTVLTVLTDGDKGLCNLARQAVSTPITPILDWFHIAMRIQHMKQTAKGLSTRVLTHRQAKKAIQDELEKLHWRLWHGHTRSVDESIKKLSDSIRRFRYYNKPFQKKSGSYRKLWTMLLERKQYVLNNDVIIANYHQRHHEGLRVSTSLVESAVNSLVNKRMNKRRQIRWTKHGAQHLLRVRTALVNGELEKLYSRPELAVRSGIYEFPMAA